MLQLFFILLNVLMKGFLNLYFFSQFLAVHRTLYRQKPKVLFELLLSYAIELGYKYPRVRKLCLRECDTLIALVLILFNGIQGSATC